MNKTLAISFGVTFICLLLVLGSYMLLMNSSNGPTSTNKLFCERQEPYKIPPEFERSLSLRKQRIQDSGVNFGITDFEYENCLNIQYADLTNRKLDGIFLFDENSTLDNLKVYIDKTYRSNDDLLTAILLHHELTHVNQFINFKRTGQQPDCVKAETEAYLSQLYFMKILNDEEINSLLARWRSFEDGTLQNQTSASSISTLNELLKMTVTSNNQCSNRTASGSADWSTCVKDLERQQIDQYIKSRPGYQQQCELGS